MSVSLEKYISQGFEQNREDDRNIWKVYISVYPSLRDFWNSVSINIVSISFFFFFEGMRTVQVSMENLMFEFKYMQKYSRDTGFVLKKKWISSLHLYRIIHELDKRCSNYYWVTKEENFFNFYHHQLLNHIY